MYLYIVYYCIKMVKSSFYPIFFLFLIVFLFFFLTIFTFQTVWNQKRADGAKGEDRVEWETEWFVLLIYDQFCAVNFSHSKCDV